MTETALGEDETAAPKIAGFWYRVVANFIDILILAVPAYAVGFVFFDWATSLGQSGRLIGFFVALCYFGVLDSRLGNGQTLGKWLLEIQVTDRDGYALSPARAVLRFLVLSVPYFLNGVGFDVDIFHLTVFDKLGGVLLTWIAFGVSGALLYLFFFNRPTRQSLHDLAVGSFVVVRTSEPARRINVVTPRLYIVVASLWLILTFIVPIPFVLLREPAPLDSLRPTVDLQHVIEAKFGLSRGVVAATTTRFFRSDGTVSTSFLEVDVQVNGQLESLQTFGRSIASAVLARHPDLLGNRVLIVKVRYGFDLGLASWHFRYDNAHTAADWQKELEQTRPLSNGT